MGLFDFAKKKREPEVHEVRRENPNGLDLLEFVVDNNHCAVPVKSVREICQFEQLLPSGLSHKSIEGVFFLGDKPVVVVDLKKYLGMKKTGSDGRFIVLNTPGREVAIHVSGVVGVNSVDKSQVLESPGAPECVTGVVRIGENPTAIFDLESIASDVLKV